MSAKFPRISGLAAIYKSAVAGSPPYLLRVPVILDIYFAESVFATNCYSPQMHLGSVVDLLSGMQVRTSTVLGQQVATPGPEQPILLQFPSHTLAWLGMDS